MSDLFVRCHAVRNALNNARCVVYFSCEFPAGRALEERRDFFLMCVEFLMERLRESDRFDVQHPQLPNTLSAYRLAARLRYSFIEAAKAATGKTDNTEAAAIIQKWSEWWDRSTFPLSGDGPLGPCPDLDGVIDELERLLNGRDKDLRIALSAERWQGLDDAIAKELAGLVPTGNHAAAAREKVKMSPPMTRQACARKFGISPRNLITSLQKMGITYREDGRQSISVAISDLPDAK
jgi:hypothetical protein